MTKISRISKWAFRNQAFGRDRDTRPLAKDPVGETPYQRAVEVEGGKPAVGRETGDFTDPMPGKVGEQGHGHPDCVGRFAVVQNRGCLPGDAEDERGHHYGTADHATRPVILEAFGQMPALKRYATLFAKFSQSGIEQVGVKRFDPSAGKRPVAGPGVPLALGAAHQQDGGLGIGGVQ